MLVNDDFVAVVADFALRLSDERTASTAATPIKAIPTTSTILLVHI
jgi:hypothetical protein